MAKEYFKSKDIEFEEVDVTNDAEKQQEAVDLSGQQGVPVIKIGNTVITGFDRPKIDAALKTANAS
jgi:glutaredoxin